jgi:hypothetical protein
MTAVEWLLVRINDEYLYKYYSKDIQQAKEMEKQQIIDAYENGFKISGEGWNGEYGINDFNKLTEEINSDQYYTERFKNK